MKYHKVIAATTDTDSAGEMIAPEAIREMAADLQGKIMSFLVEHDFRKVVGRAYEVRVEKREDGHLQLVKLVEVFEPTDTLDQIPERKGVYAGLTDGVVRVMANRSISEPGFQELVNGIEQDLGCAASGRDLRQKTGSVLLEIVIAVGTFAVLNTAGGFFKEIGAQGWRALSARVKGHFAGKSAKGTYFNLVVLCSEGGHNYEARIYVDAAIVASEASAFENLQPALAATLPALEAQKNRLVRVVFEYGPGGLTLVQRVRDDGVPLNLAALPKVPDGGGISLGFSMKNRASPAR